MRRASTPGAGVRVLVALLAVALPACSSDIPMQKTVAVTGRVLLDGQPVEGVDVRLIPTDKTNFKLQETPLGRTDPEGRFTLTTYHSGDGAPRGEYLVAIAYPDQPADGDTMPAPRAKNAPGRRKFPAVYQVPQKSGLKVTVDRPGELPAFELTSTAK